MANAPSLFLDIGLTFSKIELAFLKMTLNFSIMTRVQMYRDLSKYVKDFGIEGAFEVLAREQRETKEGYESMYKHWLYLLRTGSSFEDVLKGWIPENERLQIFAAKYVNGDAAGALPDALLKTKAFGLKQKKLKDTLFQGIRTPIIYCIMVMLAVLGMKHYLLPTIIKDQADIALWPSEAVTTYNFVVFFSDNIVMLAVALLCLLVFLYQYCIRGSSPVRDLCNAIPPFSYYQIITSGGFLLTLSSLMKSKVTLYEAMGLIEKNSCNWSASHIRMMRRRISGENVSQAKSVTAQAFESKLFDKYTSAKLRSYARTGDFQGGLDELSDYVLEVAQKRIESLSERLNWILLIAVAYAISKIALMLMAASLSTFTSVI